MAVSFITSANPFEDESGLVANQTTTFDSGATGANRLLVVVVTYENGSDPAISAITYDGVSLTKQIEATVNPTDNFSETIEIWTLAAPATGSNTIALTNSATDQDAAIFAAVYEGVDQSTPVGDTNSVARTDTDDGTFTITKTSEDDGVAWAVTRDRGTNPDGDFTAATDNTKREQLLLDAASGTAFMSCTGDRLSGSGTVTVGATQTGDGHLEDMVAAGVELLAAEEGVSGDGALEASTAVVSGTGTREITGSGTPQAQTATVSGAGTVEGGGIDDPGDLSPGIWYQISDTSTLWKDDAMTDPVTADGDRVAVVEDKSGNGVHLRETNAPDRPEYHTDGTHHWLSFDGVDYEMQTDAFSFSEPSSRIYVYEVPSVPASTRPMIDGDDTTNRAYLGIDDDGRLTMWADNFLTGHYINLGSRDYAICVYNDTDSYLEHAKGGAKGDVGSRNSAGLYFGRHVSGSPMTEHKMFEFAEWNRELSDAERADLKAYIEDTYGIDSDPKDFELTRLADKGTSTVLYGSLAANGKIYAPSFDGTDATALTVDTSDDSVGIVSSVGVDFAGSGYGNGKVYCLPYDGGASQDISVIDTSDDSVSSLAIPDKTAAHQFYGQAILIGDILYCSPYGGGRILRIDTSDDTVDFFGDELACTGVNCYGSGVLVGTDIYFIVRNPVNIQILDTTTGDVTSLDTTGFGNGNVKWVGGVLAPNGKIYCTPRDSDDILVIDTEDSNALSAIDTGLTGTDKFNGQELLGNGLVAMFPRSANQILLIDTSDDSVRYAKIIYNIAGRGDVNIEAAQKWVGGTALDSNTVYLMPFNASYPVKAVSLIETAAVTGSGELQASTVTVDGAGTVARSGAGALEAGAATVAGVGTREVTGSGALEAGAATVAGTGTNAVTGSGALEASTAVVSGTGTREVTGSGALEAGAATVSGAGTVEGAVTGSGALEAGAATVVGTGTREVTGSGALEAGAATVVGTGTREVTGSGALEAGVATVVGIGTREVTGSGALEAAPAVVDGEGTITSAGAKVGSGALEAGAATVVGIGTREVTGSGALAAGPARFTVNPTGMHPFYWVLYDRTTDGSRPAPGKLRPLVLTDRGNGQTYVIMHDGGFQARLETFTPKFTDEVFPAFQEPTLKVGDVFVRVYAENERLKFEPYEFDVQNRPFLFGEIARPRANQPVYQLLLDEREVA